MKGVFEKGLIALFAIVAGACGSDGGTPSVDSGVGMDGAGDMDDGGADGAVSCAVGFAWKEGTGCVVVLRDLRPSVGVLDPPFDPLVTQYRLEVPSAVPSLTFEVLAEGGTTLSVNGANVLSGEASDPIDLNIGENFVGVSALRLSSMRSYVVRVDRAGNYLKQEPNKDDCLCGATRGAGFGTAAALGAERLVMGVPGTVFLGGGPRRGLVLTYKEVDGKWVPDATIPKPFGATLDDFGAAVSLDGESFAAGSPGTDSGTVDDCGSVTRFSYDGEMNTWGGAGQVFARNRTGLLATESDEVEGAGFGRAVVLSGDNLLVGAPNYPADAQLADDQSGAVYMFEFVPVFPGWTILQRFRPSAKKGAHAGAAVATDVDTIVIGAPGDEGVAGEVFVYQRDSPKPDEWTLGTTLDASDGPSASAPGAGFGASLALAGKYLFVGEPGRERESHREGAVYAYELVNSNWVFRARLIPPNATGDDRIDFGASVAATEDILVVGAPYADVGGKKDAGLAYVYDRKGATWVPRSTAQAFATDPGDQYGTVVAVHGTSVLVTAPLEDAPGKNPLENETINMVESDWGAGYVFDLLE